MDAQQLKQYYFTHYTTRNGLLSNHVESIAQDEKGFLWVATINGLQRFDGHWFLNFVHNAKDPSSIPSNEVDEILIDKKKNLWLVFADGRVGVFNTNTFRFKQVNVDLSDDKLRGTEKKILEDSRGNIMLLFPFKKLITFSEKENVFSDRNNFLQPPSGWRIISLFEEAGAGKYWIACDSGLAVFNTATLHLNYRHHNPDEEPAIREYQSLNSISIPFVDSQKRLWFSHWPRTALSPVAHCYSLTQRRPLITSLNLMEAVAYYCEPAQLMEQKNGRIIMTGTPMLAEFSEEKKMFLPLQNSLTLHLSDAYNHILKSYSDKEQNIWLCTGNDGLYKFNPTLQVFTSTPHINPRTGGPGTGGVMSFVETASGGILTSAWGEGIFRYDSNLNSIPLNIQGLNEKNMLSAWDMCKRREGKIWMGMQSEEANIIVYDEAVNRAAKYKIPIFENRTIRQVVEDLQGNMWMGTQSRGVFKWTATAAVAGFEKGFSKFDKIPQALVEKLYVDSSGYLWVSTLTEGLYKVNTATGIIEEHLTEQSNPSIVRNSVGPVLQYDDSLLLIANAGLTVYNMKAHTAHNISTIDGLPNNIIMSMLKDADGFVWMGLQNGLCRFNVHKKAFTYYDREDGMVNDNFSLDAACMLNDGRFLMGTGKDFLSFYPSKITRSTAPPDVLLTEFRLSNKTLPLDSLQRLPVVKLSYDNNSILIDFASLTNLQNSKLTYYHMLEGVDKDWVKAENVQRAIYPYLDAGDYTFKVRAVNGDGLYTANITEIKISVSAPFWKSWWFYSVFLLVTGGFLFLMDRARMKRKENLQRMRSNIAGNLHEEINTALSNINILSEMAKLKAGSEPQKSKEFIEQIHNKSHTMMISMDDMLWSISPDNDSMDKTVLRMQEYIDALNNRGAGDITMAVNDNVKLLKPHMQFRHEAFLLFKECVLALSVNAAVTTIDVTVDKSHLLYNMRVSNAALDKQQFHTVLENLERSKHAAAIHARFYLQTRKNDPALEIKIPL